MEVVSCTVLAFPMIFRYCYSRAVITIYSKNDVTRFKSYSFVKKKKNPDIMRL